MRTTTRERYSLIFKVDKPILWRAYSLDGEDPVNIAGKCLTSSNSITWIGEIVTFFSGYAPSSPLKFQHGTEAEANKFCLLSFNNFSSKFKKGD